MIAYIGQNTLMKLETKKKSGDFHLNDSGMFQSYSWTKSISFTIKTCHIFFLLPKDREREGRVETENKRTT